MRKSKKGDDEEEETVAERFAAKMKGKKA